MQRATELEGGFSHHVSNGRGVAAQARGQGDEGDGRRTVKYHCAISKMLVLKVATTTSDQPGSALVAHLSSTWLAPTTYTWPHL